MLPNVFLKTLRDQRRSLLWWAVGLIILGLYVMLPYPSIAESAAEWDALLREMPPAVLALVGESATLATPAGYANSQLFLLAPVLFLIYAISQGSAATAGEEERGTLDLLLANPTQRWRLVLEKFGALILGVLALAFLLWLGLAGGTVMANVDLSLTRQAELMLSTALLGIMHGALALVIGAATGNRGLSVTIAAVVALAGYLLNSYAPLVEAIEPFRGLSPFYYALAADPLNNGINPGHAAVLIGLSLILFIAALMAFERRDLSV